MGGFLPSFLRWKGVGFLSLWIGGDSGEAVWRGVMFSLKYFSNVCWQLNLALCGIGRVLLQVTRQSIFSQDFDCS